VTLTLADIDRWHPEAVREVFHAANARADAATEAAIGLATLPAFQVWHGRAAVAARASIGRTRVDLDAHSAEAQAVARAASVAADDIQEVKDTWRSLQTEADYLGLVIDHVSGSVTAAPHPKGTAQEVATNVADLQSAVNALLAQANAVDDELAEAINMADGAVPITTPLPAPPVPTGANPKTVNKWWSSLSDQQKQNEILIHPDKIANLDGIPAKVREDLNAARLPEELVKYQSWLDHNEYSRRPNLQYLDNVRNKIADLTALQSTLARHPDVGLLLLDADSNPHTVLAAVAKGDVDKAQRIAVTVPGMNSSVRSSLESMTEEAIAQHDEAVTLLHNANAPNPESVANIAWLGYETPGMNFDVTNDSMARAGAGPLNHFYQGLAATTTVPSQSITALGHSYGSLTTSLALQQGAPVQNVVLYGSPGAEITNASQVGVAPGHAFIEVGMNDFVPEVGETDNFGPRVQDIPGFTNLSTYPGFALPAPLGDGQWHEGAYGHSEYPRLGENGILRMSGYNMAAIVAGLPQDAIKPPNLAIPDPPIIIPGP
jgi:Alpha/beta hydrolase